MQAQQAFDYGVQATATGTYVYEIIDGQIIYKSGSTVTAHYHKTSSSSVHDGYAYASITGIRIEEI